MVDDSTRATLSNIPLLKTRAGPRDKELWVQRLKEEYQAMIKVYIHSESDFNFLMELVELNSFLSPKVRSK